MTCYLCGSYEYTIKCELPSDRYEKVIGKFDDKRSWLKCDRCGLYYQINGLSDNDLRGIYQKYRGDGLRDKTVKEEFKRINAMPYSENNQRINQLVQDGVLCRGKSLDIGSGLGVFPYGIKPYVINVRCIEPNPESARFINRLGIECHEGSYIPGIYSESDFVSLVHVLEHIIEPVEFLKSILSHDIKHDGTLYVEVPDACEFDSLPYDHDEFNSTHLYFYDVSTLDRILRKAGFEPYLIRRLKYPKRCLSRITVLSRPSKPLSTQ